MSRRTCKECGGLIDLPMNGKFFCSSGCEDSYHHRIKDDVSFITYSV